MDEASKPAEVVLSDGARVALRPIAATDKDLLADAFAHLSDDSRYLRFLAPHETLTPRELRYFTEVDHHRHEAILALDPVTGHAIGVARYVATDDGLTAAEMAIAVIDDWQGRGVASALLAALVDRARANGVRRFSAVVLNTNAPMLALLRELGEVQLLRRDGAASEYWCELPAQGVGPLGAVLRHAASDARR